MKKKFIFFIIMIIIVLAIVFLSQQAYTRGFGKTIISDAANQTEAYLSKGSNWALSNIYPKISGEVQKRGDIIKSEVNQEKQKISENIGTKIKNYFSGVANSILHPETPQNCQPATTPANQANQ